MGKSRTQFFLKARDEGAKVPGDCGVSLEQQPEWFEESKMQDAIRVFHDYSAAVLVSHLLGTIVMSQVPSLLDVLLETGHHDSVQSSIKRAVLTTYHVREWYNGRVQDHEDPARRGVKLVRNMHTKARKNVSERRPKTDDSVWISQYDMALTQFAFIGTLVLNPKKLGFYGTDSELESILYYWRYIGYLLGMEDKYNLCAAGTYQEVKDVCQDIVEEVARPTLFNPQPLYTRTIEYAFVGYGKIGAAIHYPSVFNFTCELLDCSELKKSLTLRQWLSYWFFTISFSMMVFPWFRKRANAANKAKSEARIRKIMEEFKKGDSLLEERKANSNGVLWKVFHHVQSLFVFVFEKLRKSHEMKI